MPIDDKYGRVELPDATFSDIGEEEPVIVFRAKDNHAPEVIKFYRKLCVSSEAPEHHLDLIDRTLKNFKDWQRENGVRDPSSNSWLRAQTEDPATTYEEPKLKDIEDFGEDVLDDGLR